MNDVLKTQLRELADTIDRIIVSSRFPGSIRPEYLQRAVRAYPELGGKRLRPAILMWSAGALGGDPDRAAYPAAALEVFHNWTLVHDDIIDEDRVRRGVPTAHVLLEDALELPQAKRAKFGCDMAILAGDLMQGWAFSFLEESGLAAELVLKLESELRKCGYLDLISGEALDVEMSYRDPATVTLDELYSMQRGKTGALLRFAAQAGAMLGQGTAAAWESAEARTMGRFGDALALAFQLRDDYLGIFGDFAKFGKPIGSDLKESKTTLLLIHALNHLDASGVKQLRKLLGREAYGGDELAAARTLMLESGAVARLDQEIERLTREAAAALRELPETPYRELLEELTRYLLKRDI